MKTISIAAELIRLDRICRRYLAAKDRWDKTFNYESEGELLTAKKEYKDAERELRAYFKEE